jgi:ferrochelatase
MPEFLKEVRRGRPASPELVKEMTARYREIGGSPLLDITRAQAQALSQECGLRCEVAMRLWRPRVASALTELAAGGVKRVCLLPLAPFSVSVYVEAARAEQALLAGPAREIELLGVPAWGSQADFVAAASQHIARHLVAAPTNLVLTAHSLPVRVIQAGDQYAAEVERAHAAVSVHLGRETHLAYQSQGADGGDWLGPGLRQTLEAVAQSGSKHVTIAPFGFFSDHVETLYDLDIEAARWCQELGLTLVRVPALNVDPDFIRALGGIARQALA